MAPDDDQLDRIFSALSDRTRRAMLERLRSGPRSAGDLAEGFTLSQPTVSKHLKVLEGAGLVERTPSGRTTICRLTPGPLAGAHEWVAFYERFWSERLDALEALFAEKEEPK